MTRSRDDRARQSTWCLRHHISSPCKWLDRQVPYSLQNTTTSSADKSPMRQNKPVCYLHTRGFRKVSSAMAWAGLIGVGPGSRLEYTTKRGKGRKTAFHGRLFFSEGFRHGSGRYMIGNTRLCVKVGRIHEFFGLHEVQCYKDARGLGLIKKQGRGSEGEI